MAKRLLESSVLGVVRRLVLTASVAVAFAAAASAPTAPYAIIPPKADGEATEVTVKGKPEGRASTEAATPRAEQSAVAPLNFTTLAGEPTGSEDGPANFARFTLGGSLGLAVDTAGNVYVADSGNLTIRKVAPDGSVTTLAGSGDWRGADGPAAEAAFGFPAGVAVDSGGTVYVADNQSIRKVALDGTVSTLAGSWPGGYADGPGATAKFNFPQSVAVDSSGNVYVADQQNNRIRKVAPDGTVSTIAGNGTAGFLDGPAATAQFNGPTGVAVDSSGNVFVSDKGNVRIRKISPAGVVSTLAGSGDGGFADGPGAIARFSSMGGIAVDRPGNVYVADQWNNRIRKVAPDGTVTTLAGTNAPGYLDGSSATAQFAGPAAVAVDGSGNVFVVDAINNRIRKISPVGNVSTLTGSGPAPPVGTADGSRSVARFQEPTGVAVDPSGNAYIADSSNPRIRKVTADGTVTTFAGTIQGYLDGPGGTAQFRMPTGVAFSRSGTLYVADRGDHRIRKIAPDGMVTTLAGSGAPGFRDGTASEAQFSSPVNLAVDTAGNVLVADQNNHRIRKVATDGTVTTIAGSGTPGFADGPVSTAQFNSPSGVVVDGNGTIWVTDQGNDRVRMIAGGVVSILAPSAGSFDTPSGPAVDASGNVYLAEIGSHRIKMIAPDGTVTAVGGSGIAGGNDGLGTFARFRSPRSVAVGTDGTLYVADTGNQAVRIGRAASLTESATVDAASGPAGQQRQLGTDGSGATSWSWQVVRRPAGSLAPLSSASARTPTFTPDVAGLYVFRLTASNGTAQSITEVSLGPGTAYANMYSVPTNVAQIPYPDYYLQLKPQTMYLEDPYCQLTQDVVAYPASYLDATRLPLIAGAPLPAEIKRAVALKDWWWGAQPGQSPVCLTPPNKPTMRDAYLSTLARVKALGADQIVLTQTVTIQSSDNPVVALDSGGGISETDLAFIAEQAKSAGVEVVLTINLGGADSISVIPSRSWFSTFIDSYSNLLVSQARVAEENGISALEVDWYAWGRDLNGVVDIFNTRMSQTVKEIRSVYGGKLLMSDQTFFGDLPADVFNAVDMIMVTPTKILPPEKATNFTMGDLRAAYGHWLEAASQRFSPFGKPFYLVMFIQSQPDFLTKGWMEDGLCLPDCPQLNVPTDFASQAMAYEALLESVVAAQSKGTLRLGVVESMGYWFSDPLMPSAAVTPNGMFPNLSQNVRNKPAESIVYQWFKQTVSSRVRRHIGKAH